MRRREFIALMGASITWPFAALAQEAGRTYRLGCLLSAPRDNPVYTAFFDELRRRGFIEGQNLTVKYRAYALHIDLISQYAAELGSGIVGGQIGPGLPAPSVSEARIRSEAERSARINEEWRPRLLSQPPTSMVAS
jgi:hypothetical protein